MYKKPEGEVSVLAMASLDDQRIHGYLLASRYILQAPTSLGSIAIWHREIASTRNEKHGAMILRVVEQN